MGSIRSVEPQRVVFHREQRARERHGERNERTLRQVGLGGQILSDLGIRKIRLLTNTPTHVPALQGFGIEIVEQVPVAVGRRYEELAGCDGQVEGDGLGDLDAAGGAGGDLILVGAGGAVAEACVSAVSAAAGG